MRIPKVWLITGASSGFGKALTQVVLQHGDIAVATLRKPSALSALSSLYPPTRLLLLQLDVTRPADIIQAFKRTRETFCRLDVVFNNAGYALFGEVEAIPDGEARAIFEVNFWGAVGVSREAVRFFREVNPPSEGGVIFQNSSISGFLGPPGLAYYCASKHAIEGFSEALAREVLPEWNIKTCIIQPGAFDTNTLRSTKVVPTHPAYADGVTASLSETFNHLSFDNSGDPYKLGEVLYRLVEEGKENIPLHLPMGDDALGMLEGRTKRMKRVVQEARRWSVDLKKTPQPSPDPSLSAEDVNLAKAKL